MTKVAIIDYGSGNLKSVYNAVKRCEESLSNIKSVKVTDSSAEISSASHIILPGVGSFKSCLEGFYSKKNLYESLVQNVIENEKPFLGICVGMQMLCSRSTENGDHKGFGWFDGVVERMNVDTSEFKIPHMGWNELLIEKAHPVLENINFSSQKCFNAYFVHSYVCNLNNHDHEILSTNYGKKFTSMIAKKNVLGTQFHPEKSHKFGLSFLKSFFNWQGDI